MNIGWIDFAREDRAKAMEVLHFLQERVAIDELGFGIVRDAFADAFFPGTSTIQTRAKYFLLIPYILKDATSGRYGFSYNQVRAKVDELERSAARRMYDRNPNEPGLIGRSVLPKGWVARRPSDIYWNGIRTLEIYRGSCSFKEYLSGELAHRSSRPDRLGRRRTEEDGSGDDVDFGSESVTGFLDIGEIYDPGWLRDVQMELTREEAVYLEGRILNSSRTKDTLYARILRDREDVSRFLAGSGDDAGEARFKSFALEMCNKGYLPERDRRLLILAQEFNDLVYAARVLYNKMMGNRIAEELWEDISKHGLARYARLDVDDMLKVLGLPHDRRYYLFLHEFTSAMRRGDEGAMCKSVKEQERRLKGGRAKLESGRCSPDKWIGGTWLDYRLGDAARIIDDIYKGLGVKQC